MNKAINAFAYAEKWCTSCGKFEHRCTCKEPVLNCEPALVAVEQKPTITLHERAVAPSNGFNYGRRRRKVA